MTPERKRQIREKAEGILLVGHGGAELGRVLLECLLEIEALESAVRRLQPPIDPSQPDRFDD